MEKTFDQIGDALKGPIDNLGVSAKAVSSTLNTLVDEAESVLHALERFFTLFKGSEAAHATEAAKTLVGPAVAAGINYFGKGKKAGANAARSVVARPIPVAVGAVAVLGGIGLLMYLAKKMDEQNRVSEDFQSESGTVEVANVHH